MEYRVNKKTGDKIGVLGMGTSYIGSTEENEAVATIKEAYENGLNYFDLAAGDGPAFKYFGAAIGDVRKNVFYQIHFGANYETGTYGKTASVDTMRRSIAWQLDNLKTDYIDYGFIHCIDDVNEWFRFRDNGALDYIMELKKSGTVRHIGFSCHTPSTIMQVMDDVALDALMFSVNPAYDYQKGTYGYGSVDERTAIYRRCEKEGTGITVMKPFSGGQLLDAKASPFGKELTHYQCIQYALDRPGVLTVLPGIANREHLHQLLGYFNTSENERDYSVIGSFSPADAKGKCVYCNHCKPCPVGLDIGIINKYYDLSKNGDAMAADHYDHLPLHAGDCVGCGHCNSACPFSVDQMARMKEIKEYFGK